MVIWLHISTVVEGVTWDQYYNHMPLSVIEESCKWINKRLERGLCGNKELMYTKSIARGKGVKVD